MNLRTAIALMLLPAAVLAEPAADEMGRQEGYPRARTPAEYALPKFRIGSWSAPADAVAPSYRIRRVAPSGETVAPWANMEPAPPITYQYRNVGYTLDEYLERQRVTGLLILKDGKIVVERYRYDRKPDARFISFSMAKSVTSLLVGIALERGQIASLDDPAERYAKELAGSPYGGTTVRQLLRMSSGLRFTERYDGTDDVMRLNRSMQFEDTPQVSFLRGIADRHAPAGEKFVYASAETQVLGRVLAGATGRTVADLTHDWLWKPMRAQDDAFWRISPDGQEGTFAFFHASLRDWARLGLLLANDGVADGKQVVPREYLLDATDPARQPAAFRPERATPYFGYGYQFWLFPMKQRTFGMQGVYGQAVFVQPSSGIVMVQTSAWAQPSGQQDPQPAQERSAFWRGVLRSLGGSIE